MAAPTLADYEYQYKDTGIKLNSGSVLPFWDVNKVTGLDMPDIDSKIDDIDIQHGGIVYSRYVKPRIIVVEGTLYANPSTIETTLDSAIANFIPDDNDWPFYFKHPGVARRYVDCKPLAFKFDVETLRRTGACNFQIQLGAQDPLKKIDNADVTLATASTNVTVTNSGNMPTWPVFTVNGPFSQIRFYNTTTGENINFIRNAVAGDVMVVDFKTRTVLVNGVQNSAIAVPPTWWDIDAGATVQIRFTLAGGPPTSVVLSTYSGWL